MTDDTELPRVQIDNPGPSGFVCPNYSITDPKTGKVLRPIDCGGAEHGDYLAGVVESTRPVGARRRCDTCAFRRGTVANTSCITLGQALDCLMTGDDFVCHEGPAEGRPLCAGFEVLKHGEFGARIRAHFLAGNIVPFNA